MNIFYLYFYVEFLFYLLYTFKSPFHFNIIGHPVYFVYKSCYVSVSIVSDSMELCVKVIGHFFSQTELPKVFGFSFYYDEF